jgi:hypothetical protein
MSFYIDPTLNTFNEPSLYDTIEYFNFDESSFNNNIEQFTFNKPSKRKRIHDDEENTIDIIITKKRKLNTEIDINIIEKNISEFIEENILNFNNSIDYDKLLKKIFEKVKPKNQIYKDVCEFIYWNYLKHHLENIINNINPKIKNLNLKLSKNKKIRTRALESASEILQCENLINEHKNIIITKNKDEKYKIVF